MPNLTKSQKTLDTLLRTPAGILRIVDEKWAEQDCLDFKREINTNIPQWEDNFRGDCAALASTGLGFLLIGVDEKRDRRNRAEAIVPVTNPFDLQLSLESRLSRGFSPPLKQRNVWVVETERGAVLVVRVAGRKGYPIEVPGLKHQERHFLRVSNIGNERLNAEASRLLRQEIELRDRRKLLLLSAAIPTLALASSIAWYINERVDEKNFAIDANTCGFIDQSSLLINNYLAELPIRADGAFIRRNPSECWHLHEELKNKHPNHVWRYWLAGHCFATQGDQSRSRDEFQKSAKLSALAYAQNPRCGHFEILRIMSTYLAGHEADACNSIRAIANASDFESPASGQPAPKLKLTCPGIESEMVKMGLSPAPATLAPNETLLWPLNREQTEAIFNRVAENNKYDIERCVRAFPQSLRRLAFRIEVGQAGNVDHVEPEDGTSPISHLSECMMDSIKEWKFPPHRANQSVAAVFPFLFTNESP